VPVGRRGEKISTKISKRVPSLLYVYTYNNQSLKEEKEDV